MKVNVSRIRQLTHYELLSLVLISTQELSTAVLLFIKGFRLLVISILPFGYKFKHCQGLFVTALNYEFLHSRCSALAVCVLPSWLQPGGWRI